MHSQTHTSASQTQPDTLALPPGLKVLVLACTLAIAALALATNLTFYHDDAYIPLRYARNLLAGFGPVWNPGERVQGYTSPLELGLLGLLGSAGLDLRLASRLIGLASLVMLVAGVVWLQRKLARADPADPFWAIPIVLVATSCPLIVWALSGLETLLFALLVAVGCLLFRLAIEQAGTARRWLVGSGLFLGLSVLARPEGGLFLAVCLAWLVLPRRPGWIKNVAIFAFTCLAVLAPCLLWQYLYYGSIVPNTFYAKVGVPWSYRIHNGLVYVASSLLLPPYIPLALAVLLALKRSRIWTSRLGYVLSIVLAYVTYIVTVGGDHMAACRFLVPAIVPLIYAVYLALRAALPQPAPRVVVAVYVATLALAALQVHSNVLNPQVDRASDVGTAVGRYIARTWPAGSLVAVNTAGSTPYHAPDLRFIDMLGLNDAHIARRRIDRIVLPQQGWPGHMKGDGAYVLSREPDYIILGAAEGAAAWDPLFLSDLEIARDPRFTANYRGRQVYLDAQGRSVNAQGQVLVFTYHERIRY